MATLDSIQTATELLNYIDQVSAFLTANQWAVYLTAVLLLWLVFQVGVSVFKIINLLNPLTWLKLIIR